jgi:hypothetical protein
MHTTLIQQDYLKTTRMTINHNGIHVYEEVLNKKHDYFVPFENTPSETYYTRVFRN